MSIPSAPGYETTIRHLQELHTTGQFPRPIPDDPICAVLLVIYIAFGAVSMYQLKHGQKTTGEIFVPNGMQFGLCMSRIVSLCLRLAWSRHIDNENLTIAASIFVLAGVIVLEILNMVLFFRLLVRIYPHLERSTGYRTMKKVVYLGMAPGLLALTVVPGIQSQLVKDTVIRNRDIIVLKFSIIVQAIYCGVPLLACLYLIINPASSKLIRQASPNKSTRFTHASDHIPFKMWQMVLFNAFWLSFEQCFRTAESFHREKFWLQSKPTFYCTIFLPELIVIAHNLLRGMMHTFWHPYEQATGITSKSAHGIIEDEKKSEHSQV